MTQVKLEGGTPDEPDKPVRLPPPDGTYLAKIVGIRHGFTREEMPHPKLTIEWMLLKNEKNDETQKGRRVWQDYVTQSRGPDDWAESKLRRFRDVLRLLGVEVSSEGFDVDGLLEKRAWITIQTRKKKDGERTRSFTDIVKTTPMDPLPTSNGETLHNEPELEEPAAEPISPSLPAPEPPQEGVPNADVSDIRPDTSGEPAEAREPEPAFSVEAEVTEPVSTPPPEVDDDDDWLV